jgi:hypothetical protein
MIMEYIQRESKGLLASLLAISLVVLAIGTQKFSHRFMEDASVKVLRPLRAADSIKSSIIEITLRDSSLKITTLKKQYLVCDSIKRYYLNLGVAYYSNYYSFSICSIVFITLLTIAVFLVANKGWQNSSIILKAFLLSNIVLSSFYYFLPNVLGNKENLKNNMEKVRIFEKIQFDMLSLSYNIMQQDNKRVDSSIASYYDRISINLDFLTNIDDSKLNSEFSTLLKDYKPK